MNHEIELEVFRAGDYGAKGRWDETELDQIVADYNAAVHEAPVTLDHAQSGPAMGWVAGLGRRGDRLTARLRGISEEMMKLLREGAFKKRSVELYRALPETGRPYLKAVSFLGAAAPAVKGLRDALFTGVEDSADSVFIEFTEETDPAAAGEESAARFAELEGEMRRSGRWIPAWERQGLREFFAALGTLGPITIPDGGDLQPQAWFEDFLRALPAAVPFGESAPPARARQGQLPQGGRISATSVDLHRRVTMLRENRPQLSYSEALRECAERF